MALSDDLRDLYQQVILDHSRSPRNHGQLHGEGCVHVHGDNPTCGDEIDVWVKFAADGGVEDIKFEGQGCAISQASASMMTVKMKGTDAEKLKGLIQDFRATVTGEGTVKDEDTLGELALLEGVQKFPQRVKCATLAWRAVEQAMQQKGEGS
ncbi:Fe-S cluster assembly sulfur transfer protein SufU [Brevifollis gellanilyticus]|uniref:Iron-sulfur cluster assembly scaffold protein n=1 Tax=Brevifollis gellanilyticus TaxID=748831 RepID=A0A512M934_9BACT|nr:SUF system NifU family Fe-S cluster assembly protein [Brevifollis gellanilyticus]GEP43249.1 iron-sulfur cluster assembly scaffold protein [Brevifollis gellanilyticus]